jgi:hypothetical protein
MFPRLWASVCLDVQRQFALKKTRMSIKDQSEINFYHFPYPQNRLLAPKHGTCASGSQGARTRRVAHFCHVRESRECKLCSELVPLLTYIKV